MEPAYSEGQKYMYMKMKQNSLMASFDLTVRWP